MSSSYPRDYQVDVRQDWGLVAAEQSPAYSEATAYPDSLSTAYPDTQYTAYPSHTFPGVHQSPQTISPQGPSSQDGYDDNWEAESMAVREDEEPAKWSLSDPCTRCVIAAVVLTVKLIIVIVVVVLVRRSHYY